MCDDAALELSLAVTGSSWHTDIRVVAAMPPLLNVSRIQFSTPSRRPLTGAPVPLRNGR